MRYFKIQVPVPVFIQSPLQDFLALEKALELKEKIELSKQLFWIRIINCKLFGLPDPDTQLFSFDLDPDHLFSSPKHSSWFQSA